MLFDFSPKCPIRAEEREWVDTSLAWFVDTFGTERFHEIRPILPTEEFFPEEFDGHRENVQSVLHRVCGYLNVDPERLELQIFPDPEDDLAASLQHSVPSLQTRHQGAAGFYRNQQNNSKIVIAVKKSLLKNPTALVATIAHELCHVLLLADGKITQDTENMEPLTDLATVFFGMGIFTANSALQFSQWDRGWSVQRHGYLSEEIYGYALAAWSRLRKENKTSWAKHLTTNVQTYFNRSAKYLQRH